MSYHTYEAWEALLAGLTGGALVGFAIIILAAYIYSSLALMRIAQRTNTEYAWMAWIPLLNLYLMSRIAGIHWWTVLAVIFAGWIPFIGQLVALGIIAWWWWNISEKRNYPGYFGILMLIPIVNLVILGILAWGEK